MHIENHIHIMLYYFEEDLNGIQLFRNLNELFGEKTTSKSQKCSSKFDRLLPSSSARFVSSDLNFLNFFNLAFAFSLFLHQKVR